MRGRARRAREAAAAAALLLAAAPARAEQVAAAETAAVRFVDAAPPSPSVQARLAEIRRRIQAALVYPPVARIEHLEGETLVRFAIEPDGRAHDVAVYRSSGRPTLDRAALRAVADAAPLPWVYGRLEVPVRFALDARR
jgi:TonB family protein